MKKTFTLNQKVLWIVNEFDGSTRTKAVVTEVYEDHAIAKTEDGLTLWIDEDNEMEFFDLDMLEILSK